MSESVVDVAVAADAAAWEQLEAMAWPNGPLCPFCGSENRSFFLRPVNGLTRRASGSTRRMTARRLWKCRVCRGQFSALTKSALHGCRVPTADLLAAVELVREGARPRDLQRALGGCNRTVYQLHARVVAWVAER